jgi:hypothetical protein
MVASAGSQGGCMQRDPRLQPTNSCPCPGPPVKSDDIPTGKREREIAQISISVQLKSDCLQNDDRVQATLSVLPSGCRHSGPKDDGGRTSAVIASGLRSSYLSIHEVLFCGWLRHESPRRLVFERCITAKMDLTEFPS